MRGILRRCAPLTLLILAACGSGGSDTTGQTAPGQDTGQVANPAPVPDPAVPPTPTPPSEDPPAPAAAPIVTLQCVTEYFRLEIYGPPPAPRASSITLQWVEPVLRVTADGSTEEVRFEADVRSTVSRSVLIDGSVRHGRVTGYERGSDQWTVDVKDRAVVRYVRKLGSLESQQTTCQ